MDDIALFGNDVEATKSINAAEKVSLTVNDDKTEYLIVSRRNRNYGLGHTFRKVSQFKYLGSIINQENDVKTDVLSRIQLGNNTIIQLADTMV